jgi:hypothetical protein
VYRGHGLVGHVPPQGPEPLNLDTVRGYVDYQFRFPVAVDPDWQTLKRWWLDGHERSWRSVSFLIDRRGVIRHVHSAGVGRSPSSRCRVASARSP